MSLTYAATARRSFEVNYWKTIAILAEGQPAELLRAHQAGRFKSYGDIFPHLVGQPDSVRRAFEDAMGFSVR